MSAAPFASGVYEGAVTHTRLKPVRHRLAYRVFSLLIDLDELPALDARLKRFSANRLNLFSVHEKDHGPKPRPAGEFPGVKAWIEGVLAEAGVPTGGPVRMLCYPRILGYVFNPITTYFCHDAGGRLSAVLYEVSNTFGGRHAYLIDAGEAEDGLLRHEADKRLHVSPFMEMETRYHFRIRPPELEAGGRALLAIRQTDAEGAILNAVFAGERRELTDPELMRLFRAHPLMTLKIIGAIHWEAWKLWRKGLKVLAGKTPAEPVTRVG